jgi:hypothetical protein
MEQTPIRWGILGTGLARARVGVTYPAPAAVTNP